MGKLIRIIGKTMKGVTTITAYYEGGTQETIIKGRWSRVGVHIVKRPGGLPEIDGTLEIGRRAA